MIRLVNGSEHAKESCYLRISTGYERNVVAVAPRVFQEVAHFSAMLGRGARHDLLDRFSVSLSPSLRRDSPKGFWVYNDRVLGLFFIGPFAFAKRHRIGSFGSHTDSAETARTPRTTSKARKPIVLWLVPKKPSRSCPCSSVLLPWCPCPTDAGPDRSRAPARRDNETPQKRGRPTRAAPLLELIRNSRYH